jgi:hypothetical protein
MRFIVASPHRESGSASISYALQPKLEHENLNLLDLGDSEASGLAGA